MWSMLHGGMFYLAAILVGCLVSPSLSAATARDTEVDVSAACDDKEEGCASWAADNYCETQRDLMSYYCASTCGFCNVVKEATDVMAEIVETMVDATDTTGRGDTYEDKYNSYDSGYDNSYDTSYDNYETYDPKPETVTPAITNHCAGEVRNGELKDMSPSSYGYVECETGFTRNGPYYIYCNEQGIIQGDLPTCERKCSEIKVEGGSVEPPENEKQGWLYVSCDEGYTLEGKAWNWCDRGVVDVIPKCVGGSGSSSEDAAPDSSTGGSDYGTDYTEEKEVKQEGSGMYGGCPLKEVENGVWTDPYQSSTYWILECNTGFVKTGGDTYVYCDDKKEVSGEAPVCKEDKCANVKVENGVVTTQGTGDWIWVKVECNAGYSLSGSDGTYCSGYDGKLSGALGTCNM